LDGDVLLAIVVPCQNHFLLARRILKLVRAVVKKFLNGGAVILGFLLVFL